MGRPRVCVVGAGAFGGWSALSLAERGCKVTLVDMHGPGHSGSSSGGETRVVRGFHGDDTFYARWGIEALELWARYERDWEARLIERCGFMWAQCAHVEGGMACAATLADAGRAFEILEPPELAARFPQLDASGIAWAVLEHDAGYTWARNACQRVAAALARHSGRVIRALAMAPWETSGHVHALPLADATPLEADAFVFACGPWLPKLFTPLLSGRLRATRQEVYYLREPLGDDSYSDIRMPAWAIFDDVMFYGVPGNAHRGFKLADDRPGDIVDPDTLERVTTPEGLSTIRRFLAKRFPQMKDAPVTETRVCQYEMSSDGDFIIDRHPAFDNVWIAGGGSGRGFKHGPAVGRHVAGLVLGEAEAEPRFSLSRFR